MSNELIKHETLLALVAAGKRVEAENAFQGMPLGEQLRLVEAAGCDPELLMLAEDATSLVQQLAPQNTWLVFEKTSYGESEFHSCASVEQFFQILDNRVWVKRANPKKGQLPRTFHPENGLGWVVALGTWEDEERLKAVLEAIGVEPLYGFLEKHVRFEEEEGEGEGALPLSVLSVYALGPTSEDLGVKLDGGSVSEAVADEDIRLFLEKLEEVDFELFRELCGRILDGGKPEMRGEYCDAAERQGWQDVSSEEGTKKSASIFKPVDIDLDLKF